MASPLLSILSPKASRAKPVRQAAQQPALQMQQAVAAAPASMSNIGAVAQQVGGQLAALQAGLQNKQVAAAADLAGQQQQATIAGRAQQLDVQNQQKQLAVQAQQSANEQKLASISERAKQEVYDSRKQFTQDAMGLKFTNERQLSDFMRLSARSAEDLKNYESNLQVAHDRKTALLESAYRKLEQEKNSESQIVNQLRDQINTQGIASGKASNAQVLLDAKLNDITSINEAMANLEISIEQARADAANRAARNQAVGTILGAGLGAAAGGAATGTPQGALFGAQAGAGVGGGVATLVNK